MLAIDLTKFRLLGVFHADRSSVPLIEFLHAASNSHSQCLPVYLDESVLHHVQTLLVTSPTVVYIIERWTFRSFVLL